MGAASAHRSRGRPRTVVNFAMVISSREDHSMGWIRMAQEYRKQTGQFISSRTIKRRYAEARGLVIN